MKFNKISTCSSVGLLTRHHKALTQVTLSTQLKDRVLKSWISLREVGDSSAGVLEGVRCVENQQTLKEELMGINTREHIRWKPSHLYKLWKLWSWALDLDPTDCERVGHICSEPPASPPLPPCSFAKKPLWLPHPNPARHSQKNPNPGLPNPVSVPCRRPYGAPRAATPTARRWISTSQPHAAAPLASRRCSAGWEPEMALSGSLPLIPYRRKNSPGRFAPPCLEKFLVLLCSPQLLSCSNSFVPEYAGEGLGGSCAPQVEI
jgi:hypothetical protein